MYGDGNVYCGQRSKDSDEWKEDPEYWESKEETARERDAWRDSRRDPWDRELPDDQDE